MIEFLFVCGILSWIGAMGIDMATRRVCVECHEKCDVVLDVWHVGHRPPFRRVCSDCYFELLEDANDDDSPRRPSK